MALDISFRPQIHIAVFGILEVAVRSLSKHSSALRIDADSGLKGSTVVGHARCCAVCGMSATGGKRTLADSQSRGLKGERLKCCLAFVIDGQIDRSGQLSDAVHCRVTQ